MDLNLSPSQLNQSNVDANDNSLPQFREMTMDGQEATNLLVHTAEASAVSESLSKKSTLKRFREMTMDGQEATNLLVHTAEAFALSESHSKKPTLKRFREMTMDGQEAANLLVHMAEASAVCESHSKKPTLKRKVVMGLSAYPAKWKSLGRPKALKIGREKANKDSQDTVVIIDGDNAVDESQLIPILLRAEKNMQEIPLPTGIEMKQIADNEYASEDIGHVLQFLEFCRVFGKALEFKKGEAGVILRSLTRKQNLRHVQNTLAIEFQVRLLSLIVSDSDIRSASITASNGKSSWLNALKNLITESDRALQEFPLDWLNRGVSGYYELELSQKLILLNFICDEALGTKALRKYIDDQNATFTEEKKAGKTKVAETKEKEKNLRQQLEDEMAKMSAELQDETAKTVVSTELQKEMEQTVVSTELQGEKGKVVMSTELQDEMAEAVMSTEASLPNSDHETLLANLRREADKAHTELLEAKGEIPKWKKYCEAVRIEPAYLDNNGKAFWKLGSCKDEYSFLLQDVKREDEDSVEKWFAYGADQKDEVNKYISCKRGFDTK